MPTFVDTGQTSKSKSNKTIERLDLSILAMAKKTGLTFDEISLFTLNDLVLFIEVWSGKKSSKPKKINQEAIDRFFSN